MKIAEIFYSIQGEGLLAGVPSVFVRTSGCPLRCWFCDTEYTSWRSEGENWSIPAILAELDRYPTRHVVLTGGEPMVAPEIDRLCEELRQREYHITIETAAIIFKPIACDLASLSPKLASSTPYEREGGRHALRHEEQRWRPEVVRAFLAHCDYQLKFVIDKPEDVQEVHTLLNELPLSQDVPPLAPLVDPTRVLLMPQGVTPTELQERSLWLVELCKEYGFRYCPRLHVQLYGNRRGV